MKRALLVARFIATACLVAWILLVPLSFLGKAYGRGLRATTGFAVQDLGTGYKVRVRESGKKRKDTAILVRRNSPQAVRRTFSSWATGYLPTVCAIALVLATPIAWRRRGRALLIVVALTQVYVAARVALLVVQMLLGDEEIHAELPSLLTRPAVHDFLVRMTNVDRETGFFFLVPLALWAVFTLRVEDFERLWLAPAASAEEHTTDD